ncbi:hypothetical protein CPB86DRAFT_781584 [Serendipita vermifera]|nr:hypothetical protein CPB86DRAFT_781584 [Serendipita vermifera]
MIHFEWALGEIRIADRGTLLLAFCVLWGFTGSKNANIASLWISLTPISSASRLLESLVSRCGK